MSKLEQIAKEQKEKSKHIESMNDWLAENKYDFKIVNYSACGLKGDHEKAEKTLVLMADTLQQYVTKNL